MPYPFRRGRTVTLKRYEVDPRTRDRTLADPQPDPVPRCAYDPGSTSENEDGSSVDRNPRFFGPYDLEVHPDDEVTIQGVDGVFEVDGEVLRLRNELTGREHCCEVKLTRRRGAVR